MPCVGSAFVSKPFDDHDYSVNGLGWLKASTANPRFWDEESDSPPSCLHSCFSSYKHSVSTLLRGSNSPADAVEAF